MVEQKEAMTPEEKLGFLEDDAGLDQALLEDIFTEESLKFERMKVEYLALCYAGPMTGNNGSLMERANKLKLQKKLVNFIESLLG